MMHRTSSIGLTTFAVAVTIESLDRAWWPMSPTVALK
jgi:hypothetical protein